MKSVLFDPVSAEKAKVEIVTDGAVVSVPVPVVVVKRLFPVLLELIPA